MSGIFASRFARTVTVTHSGGSISARAFIQPLDIKNPETPLITAAGLADERRWLLIMEPMALSGPVEITDGGACYELLRREEIGSGDHIEGILCLKGGGTDA